MLCPVCSKPLRKAILCNTEVDFCPSCLGIWFERDELRWAKDQKDESLNWLDIDIWKDEKKFKISRERKLCPVCRLPLYEVSYGDSEVYSVKSSKSGVKQFNRVKVDVCNLCYGIWLDRGEFKEIIEYLKKKADFEILNNYAKNLLQETAEVFIGPESLREEILDLITILKLFKYKFAVQYPAVTKIISSLPG